MVEIKAPVLIVGGDTVGLYLAMELGWRGDAVPDDPGHILDIVTGRATA